uniref:Amino acid transporter transmembrane domain-containing protein n=1 Tax=Grammatophora oceanica TaxID=210454 RepID=A0A7S1VUB1_9STRA
MVVVIGERTSLLRDEPITQDEVFQNPYWHYGSTLFIVLACFVGAVAAPGVAIVWSICGSFLAFLISFILPSACYLKIGDDGATSSSSSSSSRSGCAGEWLWRWFSIVLLIGSVIGAVVCMRQTVMKL